MTLKWLYNDQTSWFKGINKYIINKYIGQRLNKSFFFFFSSCMKLTNDLKVLNSGVICTRALQTPLTPSCNSAQAKMLLTPGPHVGAQPQITAISHRQSAQSFNSPGAGRIFPFQTRRCCLLLINTFTFTIIYLAGCQKLINLVQLLKTSYFLCQLHPGLKELQTLE